MKALVGFFVDRPALVNLIMVLVFVAGVTTIEGLRYEYNPTVDFGFVSPEPSLIKSVQCALIGG